MSNVVIRFIGENTSLRRAFAQSTSDAMKFKATSTGLAGSMASVGASMLGVGRSMTLATLPIAVLLGVGVKLATEYEDSVNKMQRLAGVSAGQAKQWSTEILQLSKDVAVGPNELADALYFVASSGAPVAEAMNIIKMSGKAAAVGMGDVATLADAFTSVINVYGKEHINAARASDILTAAVREGKGEADAYAKTIGRITPVAKLLGIGFDEVAAAMAVTTNRGLTAAESATGIRQAFLAFIKPTAAARKEVAKMGSSYDELRAILSEQGLLAGFRKMNELANGNKETLAKLFPNVRGLNTALLLMDSEGAAKTNDIFKKVTESTGALDDAFQKAEKTAKFKFNKALSTLKTIGIEIGQQLLPPLAQAATWVGGLATKFGELSPTVKAVIAGILAAIVVLGPLILIIGGVTTALSALFSPIGLVVLAVAALAAGAVYLYKNWEPFQRVVDTVGGKLVEFWNIVKVEFPKGLKIIKDVFNDPDMANGFDGWVGGVLGVVGAIGTFVRAIPGAVADVKQWFQDNKQTFVDFKNDVVGIFNTIVAGLQLFAQSVITLVTPIAMFFVDVFNRIKDPMINAFTGIWDAITQIFRSVWKIIQGVWDIIAGAFTGDWSRVWEGIKEVFSGVWEGMLGIIKLVLNTIGAVITFTLGVITSAWGYAWGGLKTAAEWIWGGIKSFFGKVWDWIGAPVVNAVSTAYDWIVGIWNSVVGFVTGLPDRIASAASGMWDGIKNAFRAAINWVIDKWNGLSFGIPKLDLGPLGSIGGGNFSVPQIPRLAEGGIVKHEMLAMLGDRKYGDPTEIVFPKADPARGYSLLDAAGVPQRGAESGDGAGITIIQHITAIDPREAAQTMGQEAHWASLTNIKGRRP